MLEQHECRESSQLPITSCFRRLVYEVGARTIQVVVSRQGFDESAGTRRL